MTCIRCGAAAPYVLHPLTVVACDDCMHAWLDEESCSLEAVNEALGFSGRPEDFTKTKGAEFDAELLRRTEAWAAKHREEAA